MGRSFSSIFGVGEPLFGFAQLTLEVPNPSLERAEVALGRQVEHASEALDALLECPFDTTAETKRFHRELLNPWIAHELRNPGVLEQGE